ncbi:MAG: HPr family phosphocarrier protein, partial [Chloroflexi bacterium]
MIGIVVVSHSQKLAEGVVELVNQMTQGQVPLVAAGGIDDPQHPIGTDAIRILDAIESVFSPDGVLVLMDMGSALLSAETALDFLPDEQRTAVRLCSAPLVEGAMAAAVQATATTNLDEIVAEAHNALIPKTGQLGDVIPPAQADAPPAPGAETAQSTTLTIRNQHGLHARPAARFVSTAGRFESQITVRDLDSGKGPVNAKSINQVATLGAGKGHRVVVTAAGPDAAEALSALEQLAAANFGEAETAHLAEAASQPAAAPAAGDRPAGIAVSPGIAVGPVALYRPAVIAVTPHTISDPQAEHERLESAIQKAKTEIAGLYRQAKKVVGGYEAAIFEAHQLFLDDPALVNTARAVISAEKINAEAAWQRAVEQTVADYRALGDEYLQARADDVLDVGRRVLKLLAGVAPPSLDFEEPVILVARDLAPSDTAQLNPEKVLGLCTELGSATSHSAILARALGIPAVVGLGETILHVTDNSLLALDGATG